MKTIKGDLILKKDTVFEESIRVEGNIKNITIKKNTSIKEIHTLIKKTNKTKQN